MKLKIKTNKNKIAIELKTFQIFESILRCDNFIELKDKYLMHAARNLIFILRKHEIIKNSSRTIYKSTFFKYLKKIGYGRFTTNQLKKFSENFLKSNFIENNEDDFFVLKPINEYEKMEKTYLTYSIDFNDVKKFNYRKFKKEVIQFIYSRPKQISEKNHNGFNHLNFTTQEKVANILNINQVEVSNATKDDNKIYTYQRISEKIKNWDEAKNRLVKISNFNQGRYTILTDYRNTSKASVYFIYKLIGSSLAKEKSNTLRRYYNSESKFTKRFRNYVTPKRYGKRPYQFVTATSNKKCRVYDGKTDILLNNKSLHIHCINEFDKDNSQFEFRNGDKNNYFSFLGKHINELQYTNIHRVDYKKSKKVKEFKKPVTKKINNIEFNKVIF